MANATISGKSVRRARGNDVEARWAEFVRSERRQSGAGEIYYSPLEDESAHCDEAGLRKGEAVWMGRGQRTAYSRRAGRKSEGIGSE